MYTSNVLTANFTTDTAYHSFCERLPNWDLPFKRAIVTHIIIVWVKVLEDTQVHTTSICAQEYAIALALLFISEKKGKQHLDCWALTSFLRSISLIDGCNNTRDVWKALKFHAPDVTPKDDKTFSKAGYAFAKIMSHARGRECPSMLRHVLIADHLHTTFRKPYGSKFLRFYDNADIFSINQVLDNIFATVEERFAMAFYGETSSDDYVSEYNSISGSVLSDASFEQNFSSSFVSDHHEYSFDSFNRGSDQAVSVDTTANSCSDSSAISVYNNSYLHDDCVGTSNSLMHELCTRLCEGARHDEVAAVQDHATSWREENGLESLSAENRFDVDPWAVWHSPSML